MNVRPLENLARMWRHDAETLRHRAASVQAELLESVADDLDRVLREWTLEALSLDQAAAESGFSYSTLQQRLAGGSLPNVGEKGSPRIRRCDLPFKGGTEAPAIAGEDVDLAGKINARRWDAR